MRELGRIGETKGVGKYNAEHAFIKGYQMYPFGPQWFTQIGAARTASALYSSDLHETMA